MNRTYLDAVNPTISKISFTTDQKKDLSNSIANRFLKVGTKLETTVVINEKLKALSKEELETVSVLLNVYVVGSVPEGVSITNKNYRNYVTVKAKEMLVDEQNNKTTITFEKVAISKNMNVEAIDTGSFTKQEDYEITIKSITNIGLLKDYADNSCASDSDYRDETEQALFLDNTAPAIQSENEKAAANSTKYKMESCGKEAG